MKERSVTQANGSQLSNLVDPRIVDTVYPASDLLAAATPVHEPSAPASHLDPEPGDGRVSNSD